MTYKGKEQLEGSIAHRRIESGAAGSKDVLCSLFVSSNALGLYGKIDKYFPEKGLLVESKLHISEVSDGHLFQAFAQYYAMQESGYVVNSIRLYSIDDHRAYDIDLPEDNPDKRSEFFRVVNEMKSVSVEGLRPKRIGKCGLCVYRGLCEWGGDA